MIRTLSIATLLLLFTGTLHAQIYRWVDDEGKVHYGDRIPPKYAKQEQQTLNTQGLQIDSRAREKTAEERAEERRAEAERAAAAAREAELARYDDFLRSTYPTLGSLERARDDRLAIMDGQVRNAEKSQVEASEALRVLEERAANIERNGNPVPERLQSQIAAFTRTRDEAERRIGSVKAERETVAEQFAQDERRLRQLLGGRRSESGD